LGVRCIFEAAFFFSPRLKNLYPSRTAIKTDGHLSRFNDDGNFALAVGMLQHRVELVRIRNDVEIFNLFILFGISFTSCPRVRSGIFAENQYFFRHG
jgi:hypothetical protein